MDRDDTLLADDGGHDGLARMVVEAHRAVLTLMRRVLGPDHPDVANVYSSIATAWQGQGKYPEAEAEERKALDLRQRVLGPSRP